MQKVKIAVFPKGFMNELTDGRMSIFEWIEMAGTLDVDGLELYPTFLKSTSPEYLEEIKSAAAKVRLQIPMMCTSPDFTHPDENFRKQEVNRMKQMMEVMTILAPDGFRSCRVLSGQNRPEVDRENGIRWTVECINELLPHAENNKIHLVMENHYKDGFWIYPEFAQKTDIYLEIFNQIHSSWFGANYDPSNAIFAGEDPIRLLAIIKHRIITMHASDRYVKEGYTLHDLKNYSLQGYSEVLAHGVIGKGINDYDQIFDHLRTIRFNNWISIEDGVNGLDELKDSVRFLRRKVEEYL